MGVENLVYESRTWIKGNKYYPKEKAVVYVRVPFSKSPFFKCLYTSRKRDILHPDEIRELRTKRLDVLNLGLRRNPFFLDSFLERAIIEYEIMCQVTDRVMRDREPLVMRLSRFIEGVDQYLHKPSELARQRIIYVAELMNNIIPSEDIYNFILDIELKNNDIARLRIERYQAILAGDDVSIQELDKQIEQLTSARVRGLVL